MRQDIKVEWPVRAPHTIEEALADLYASKADSTITVKMTTELMIDILERLTRLETGAE